jgi:hypothetical protein
MKFSIIFGAVLIAAAIMLTNRYELYPSPGLPGQPVYMLDRWTHTVTRCIPDVSAREDNELTCVW